MEIGYGYGYFLVAKNIGKNTGKNITKNVSGKYSQERLDHAKQSATDALKTTSKRVIQKTEEVAGDLIGSKTADKIIKVSRNSQQNNSETVTNENDNEISKERYLSPEKRQGIINDLKVT